MSILNIQTEFAGQAGMQPRIVKIVSNDSFSTITAAGYLNGASQTGYQFYPNDIVAMSYGTDSSTSQLFTLSIANSVITLVPMSAEVALPVNANHIAVFSDSAGSLTDDVETAINGGNIQAGLSGTPGALISFPSNPAKGSLVLAASNNIGDTVTVLTTAGFGQATTLTIPDPANANAKIPAIPGALVNNNLVKASGTAGVLADVGARIIAGTTAAFGGGGATHNFAVPGLTEASVGAAVMRTSTNNVAVIRVVPSTDLLSVTWAADPGASTTMDYIYVTASLT